MTTGYRTASGFGQRVVAGVTVSTESHLWEEMCKRLVAAANAQKAKVRI